MSTLLFTLFLGFILGIKHAFEADHVIAVSTIVSQQKNPFKASLVGTFWGIGHTTTLFIIGIIVLLLKISIPQKLSVSLEGLVGVMLVILGIRALRKARILLHTHKHEHGEIIHEHLHEEVKSAHRHHVSFFVGFVHGVAGSGVLMLLVLSTIHTLLEGVYYILLFGLGSTFGMSAMSFLIGLPFSYLSKPSSSNKFPKVEMYLRIIAGILSIGFGLFTIQAVLRLI